MQTDRDTYDAKKYPLCAPCWGKKGQETERFKREFLAQLQKVDADEDWQVDDVLIGVDQGGDAPNAEKLPPHSSGTW